MSLISDKEARKQGGQSDVKEEEAITVSVIILERPTSLTVIRSL